MLRLSPASVILLMVMSKLTWAYNGLTVESGSGSHSDQMVALATEHSLIDQGCTVIARGGAEHSPTSGGTLILRLMPMATDQTHGRYSGYGIQMDSILRTASIRSQLIDPVTQKILASFDETAEERQIPSSNGSQDLSAFVTEGQVFDALTRSLGSQLATKLAGSLKREGVCGVATSITQPQAATPPAVHPAPVEANELESTSIQGPIATPTIELSTEDSKKKYSAKVVPNSTGNAAHGEYRVALVIGNAHYDHIPTLRNPSNDARFISEQIVASGFELVGGAPLLDLTQAKLERSIADFGRLLSQHPGAVGFFYYAGHGVQVNGSNYLVPTDANPNRIADLSRQAIEVDSLLQEMEDSRTGLNILVLDACRNNPFGGRGIRESGAGLAQMRAPKGSIIVYATQPGNIAQDGPSGQNSPFAKALASALADSDLDLFGTFNEVGLMVANATGGEQQPWISSSPISGRFCFKGCPR